MRNDTLPAPPPPNREMQRRNDTEVDMPVFSPPNSFNICYLSPQHIKMDLWHIGRPFISIKASHVSAWQAVRQHFYP